MDIEDPTQLEAYLRHTGRLDDNLTLASTVLPGGVSNRTVHVRLGDGREWVLKQALAKLRVPTEWLSDPARVHREALGLRWLSRLLPPGSVPEFVFEDFDAHVLAMTAVPRPHENWKSVLLRGSVSQSLVGQFGAILGALHRESARRRDELEPLFADRQFFESLRLDPYYRFAATQAPIAANFMCQIANETLIHRDALVHGDYSPKNCLVREGRLVLLDHEVIHWGDPAFDVGFALTHLLAKAMHLACHRPRFAQAARLFWNRYAKETPGRIHDLEPRAVRHTLACLLARAVGRSPLEYLDASERAHQRDAALAMMASPPHSVDDLVTRWLTFQS